MSPVLTSHVLGSFKILEHVQLAAAGGIIFFHRAAAAFFAISDRCCASPSQVHPCLISSTSALTATTSSLRISGASMIASVFFTALVAASQNLVTNLQPHTLIVP